MGTGTFQSDFRHARAPAGHHWVPHPQHYKNNGYLTLGGGKTYHPGLPPNNDGNMSWSLGDRAYVNNGDKGGCTSDYFKYPGRTGMSVTCPDNSP